MLRKLYPLLAVLIWSCNDKPKQIVENLEEDAKPLTPAVLSLDSLKNLPQANHFYFIGNWGRHGQEKQQEIADKMAEAAAVLAPDAIFTLGDNFVPRGVKSIEDPAWKSSYESVYSHHLLHCPWYVALGDRDYKSSVNALMNYGQISARWMMPAKFYHKKLALKDSVSISAYIFDTPSMETQMKNEEQGSMINFRDSVYQQYWYKNTMKNDLSAWKIGIGHHDLLSSQRKWKEKGTSSSVLGAIMEESGALDFYFSAQEEEVQVLKHDSLITQFVVVGSGSKAGDKKEIVNKDLKYNNNQAAFAILSLNSNTALLQIISAKGAVLYSKKVNK